MKKLYHCYTHLFSYLQFIEFYGLGNCKKIIYGVSNIYEKLNDQQNVLYLTF